MDFILLGFVVFYSVKGIFKGFVSQVFSLIGTFFILVLAWKLCGSLQIYYSDWNLFTNSISNLLNNLVPGTFENISEFEAALGQTNFSFVWQFLLSKLLPDLSFDGTLTAGQILAPSVNNLLVKILVFLILFVFLALILKIIKLLVNKLTKICGLSAGNRILGGIVGLTKGLLIFSILFLVFVSFANITMNETLISFSKSGELTNLLYDNLIKKAINLFY